MKCYVVQKKSVHYNDDYYITVPKPMLFAKREDADQCLFDINLDELKDNLECNYDGKWSDLINEDYGFYDTDKRKKAEKLVKDWPDIDDVTDEMFKQLVPFYESDYTIYTIEVK